jgi:predicted glutamine amidotransferase
MCRLFATISNTEVDANYLLERASQSLLFQSQVKRKELQKDGWGIGWFEKGRPKILKSPKPIYRDHDLLRRAMRRARGKVLVGHVRWASNPLKLPKNHLIGRLHSQPFSFRPWLFVHNGTLLIPKEVREALGPMDKCIKGNNDSEVFFYWLMKNFKDSKVGPLTPALSRKGRGKIMSVVRRSLRGIETIWETCRKKYPLYKYPYHGLNWVLTNGKILIAMCYVNPGGFGKAKALCDRRKPYYQLQLSVTPKEVCVASEPLDSRRPWKAMSHGEIVIATRTKNSVKMEMHRVDV